MNKVLIITHAFPPFSGGGVQRIVKFSIYMREYGWQPIVIAPREKNDSWLDHERYSEVKDVEQYRIGYKNFKNEFIITRIIRKLLPIDAYFFWSLLVFHKIPKKVLNEVDIVFTSGPPHASHITGFLISTFLKKKWIADFRDHFTLNPEYRPVSPLHKFINRAFEKLIFKKASAIILNTDTNRSDILKKFTVKDNLHVIYNGYDTNDLICSDIKLNWEETKTHYLYLGGLRGDHIDGIFYKVLKGALEKKPSLKNELSIHVVGDFSRKGDLIKNLELEDLFDFVPAVSFNMVGDYLKASDACLTWQKPNIKYKGTIAGKLFDYLAMKKPIFSLGQPEGEVENILKKYNIGISANASSYEDSVNMFIEFHEKVKSGFYKQNFTESLEKFDRKNQALNLVEIFNRYKI